MQSNILKQSLLLWWGLLCFQLSIGQAPDTLSTILEVGLSGNIQRGNFQRDQIIAKTDFTKRSHAKKWAWESRNLYLFQSVFGNRTQNDLLSRQFFSRKTASKATYSWGFLQNPT